MSTTPNLVLPFVVGGQADGYVLFNEGLVEVDSLLMLAVEDRDLTAPPGSPASGQSYIPKATATDAWTGKENKIALWYSNGWKFFTPKTGWLAWLKDEQIVVRWDGTSWKTLVGEAVIYVRKTASTALTGSFAGITWGAHDRYNDGVFTHSTSSNTDQIIVKEAGDVLVDADVTIDGTSGTSNVELQVTVNGSIVGASLSHTTVVSAGTPDKTTTRVFCICTVAANDVVRVEGRIASGGGAAQFLTGATRAAVRRV